MIYQLKITLKDTSPPIWRRILVASDMVLTDLHRTIQIAFDWSDMHLHCFRARRTNGQNLTRRNISIGTFNKDLFDWMDYDFNEAKEKLSDWLVQEKDKLMYIYDFGDDWRHEIVLEKIVKPEGRKKYPYCVKALRGPVEEGCGGFVKKVEATNPNELKAMINTNLESIAKEMLPLIDDGTQEKISKWKRLLQLTKDFHALAPWDLLDDYQIFAIQIPTTKEFAYCSVMGGQSQEFGLAAFLGEEGLEALKKIIKDPTVDYNTIYHHRSLVLSFCDRNEITPKDYEIIKDASFKFRGKKKWPMFRSFIPGYYPWYLSDEEIDWFTVILERAIFICQKEGVKSTIAELGTDENCFCQIPVFRKNKITWEDSYVSLMSKKREIKISKLYVDDITLQKVKTKYKKFNIPLEIDAFFSAQPVQKRKKERPYYPIVFAAIEKRNKMLVFYDTFSSDQQEQEIQTAFIHLMGEIKSIPKEIWVHEKLYAILKPMLERLGVSAIVVEKLRNIAVLQNAMYEFFA